MATTTYLELTKTYQDQVLGLIEQNQKLAVESVTAWAKAAQPLVKGAPAPAVAPIAGVPTPKELVDSTYGFATKLLDAQHQYFTAVLAAAEPALPVAPKVPATPAAAK
jgi:hypothetical protein